MTCRILRSLAFLALGLTGFASERPNFLLIVADDCTYSDLPLYGGENATTPNIDRLAESGLTFNQAYLGSAMCQPARSELYSGLYPLSNGAAWNHSSSRQETTSLPHHLRPLGYRVGLAGKVHVSPRESFPFDRVPGFDDNCVRNPTRPHETGDIREYMSADQHDGPFCLVVALVEPHVPWVMGDASQYPPEEIKLPPYLADTEGTREAYSRYLAEITYMDSQVGDVMEALEESGSAEDTVVLFTSEQGSQFPGCKWTNWSAGVRTGLVASWPGRIPEGRRTDALVQYADLAPTLIDLADGAPRGEMDGSSFTPVIAGEADEHRRYAYAMHNNLPEGPAYPIRSVTDGAHRYIRNLGPERAYVEKHLMGGANPYWSEWVGANPMRQPKVTKLTNRYLARPAEQLYDLADDPHELENLAGDSSFAEEKAEEKERLSDALDAWLEAEGDPGAPVDTREALRAARRGEHLHGGISR